MGLRLWKDPDDDVVAEDAAAKLDRAAAARRSTIRRETSVRPGRDQFTPQSMSTFLRSRHQSMLRTRERLRQEERETDAQIQDLQAELHRLQQRRQHNRSRLDQAIRTPRAGRDTPTLIPQVDAPHQDVINEPNTESSREAQEALPQPPTVNVPRFEHLLFPTSRSSSPWRYQVLSRTTMPSPPRSTGSRPRDSSIPDGPIPGESWSRNSPRMPALTEGFAPAHASQSTDSQPLDSTRAVNDARGLESPPPEAGFGEWARLHRVHHISPSHSPSPSPPPRRLDGLGDRRRSLSRDWILDARAELESQGSSPYSHYSDILRDSNNSSQATSTSFGEIGATDDTCELDLPEGITAEDVREIRQRYYNATNDAIRAASSDPYPQIDMAILRGHMDRSGNRARGLWEAIIDRLHRRQPVPREWWVIVDLPPTFGQQFPGQPGGRSEY